MMIDPETNKAIMPPKAPPLEKKEALPLSERVVLQGVPGNPEVEVRIQEVSMQPVREDAKVNQDGEIRPDYYARMGDKQPMKVWDYWDLPGNLVNVVKHVFRSRWSKAGLTPLQELHKARTYLNERIRFVEEMEKIKNGER